MEPVRPASARRRPRRGSVDRPVDVRLVRNVALVLVLPALIVLLTLSRTGSLPPPALPPTFDGAAAAALTRELVRENPSRVPGSPSAAGAARWVADRIQAYGLRTESDTWREELPGLGSVELTNVAAIVPGTLEKSLVVVAHRDNRPGTAGVNDNASGTATLLELARAYATVGTGGAQPRRPLHTIVFLSTDAGAYSDRGARRFARSPRGERVAAAVVLDGLSGRARPQVELAGLGRRTPPTALVRTLAARLRETGARPLLPGALAQLIALGVPLALGEQGPLLREGIPAVRVGTAGSLASAPGTDELSSLDETRLTRLGTAIDATLGSLDEAVELPGNTGSRLVLSRRAVGGWALELLLLAALVPYGAAVLDLLARSRRRGVSVRGAWRAYRRRLGFWLLGLVALAVTTTAGALPGRSDGPPRPDLPPLDRWPTAVILALAGLGLLAWLRARLPLVREEHHDAEEELAGWAVALLSLLGVAVAVAATNPFTLAFLLPSLYAWLALVQVGRERAWLADLLYGAGLLGPVVAVVTLAEQHELGLRAPLYVLALITSGTVPWLVTLSLAAWVAAAAQIGALVSGRYAPAGRVSRRR
jgi:hypothetical protein